MNKLILTLFLVVLTLRVDAAMVRVVDVRDGRTLVVEHDGKRETVQLAGVAIVDDARATDLLRWNVVSTWVMLEAHPGGGYLVYRSPDALFVNRELVVRGYARATAHGIEPERNLAVTYLGVLDPPGWSPATATQPRTSSDTRRRSSASRAPRTPAGSRPRASGRNAKSPTRNR
jgi:hypothetical protein